MIGASRGCVSRLCVVILSGCFLSHAQGSKPTPTPQSTNENELTVIESKPASPDSDLEACRPHAQDWVNGMLEEDFEFVMASDSHRDSSTKPDSASAKVNTCANLATEAARSGTLVASDTLFLSGAVVHAALRKAYLDHFDESLVKTDEPACQSMEFFDQAEKFFKAHDSDVSRVTVKEVKPYYDKTAGIIACAAALEKAGRYHLAARLYALGGKMTALAFAAVINNEDRLLRSVGPVASDRPVTVQVQAPLSFGQQTS